MPKHFIYPIYTSALVLLTFALVPRNEIRRLAVFAIIFGGGFDVLAILLLKFTGMGGYINFSYFGAFGIPLFPPISWVAFFIMFLFLLPRKKPWVYLFPIITASYSIYFSNVLQSLGIFRWNYGSPILHFLVVYLPWECSVAWIYLRLTNEKKMPGIRLVNAPAMKKERIIYVPSERLRKR